MKPKLRNLSPELCSDRLETISLSSLKSVVANFMMKSISFAFITMFLFLSTALSAQDAGVPKLINYQGRLTDAAGTALPNGNYTLKLELFDQATGGQLVWGETRANVPLVSGIFNIILGGAGSTPVAGAAVNDLGFAFGSSDRYLQTSIVSGPNGNIGQTLAPRQQLASVPYAMSAPGMVPIGGIIMWWGALATIPQNFELCDGGAPAAGAVLTGLKPDLRGRFPRGASTGVANVTNNPGGSGGADSLNLAHTHSSGTYVARILGPANAGGGQSIWHQLAATDAWTSSRYLYVEGSSNLVESDGTRTIGFGTAVGGVSGSSLGVVENRPAYREVFYIIRVK